MNSENILLDAPGHESPEVTLLDKKDTAVSGEFDTLLEQGNTYLKEQEYAKAAECFEKARKTDITRENEVLDSLAKAYVGCEDAIRAMYWLECASEELGKEGYEHDLMTLYQTGVAGSELKEEAENYFVIVAKEEKKREAEERRKSLKDYYGPEKPDYPRSFTDKLRELIEFERTLPYKIRDINKELKDANGKKEEKLKTDLELLNKKHESLLNECKAEKEKCHAEQNFFFEYPMSIENRYSSVKKYRKSKGHCLYGFGSEDALPFYLNDEGYDTIYDTSLHAAKIDGKYCHVPTTYLTGEKDFFFFDEKNVKGYIKDKDYDVKDAELFISDYFRNNLVAKLGFLKQFLVGDSRFITLYCDWDYMKEHADEKYEMAYLWDTDVLYVNSYSDYCDKLESLQTYYDAAKDLTDLYLPIGEDKTFKDMKEYVIAWSFDSQSMCTDVDCYDMRYMKKAFLILHNNKIIAIVLPKQSADVIKIHARKCTVRDENYQLRTYNRVESIRREAGTNWEYYVATTMDYIAFKLGNRLKPVDLTEAKPEGLPGDLWRLWIRFRYAQNVEK